jgi:hypothetical protein
VRRSARAQPLNCRPYRACNIVTESKFDCFEFGANGTEPDLESRQSILTGVRAAKVE